MCEVQLQLQTQFLNTVVVTTHKFTNILIKLHSDHSLRKFT